MPSVPLYPRLRKHSEKIPDVTTTIPHPFPHLLQTPSGLAILELQGTINVPSPEIDDGDGNGGEIDNSTSLTTEHPTEAGATSETEIGKFMFPDYKPDLYGKEDTKWMKRVYLYVGKYQRLTGEVKKLPKPLAVIQRRQQDSSASHQQGHGDGEDELEVVEIITYKILFPSRPEPVGLEE
jgi:chromosome transmission fidelity protein 8